MFRLSFRARQTVDDLDVFRMLKVRGKLPGAGVAIFRIPFQCSKNDLLHFDRNFGIDFARRNGIVDQAVVHHRERIGAVKRRVAGQHFVEDDPEGIDIAAGVAAFPLDLLGRNVIGRAHGVRELGKRQAARALGCRRCQNR